MPFSLCRRSQAVLTKCLPKKEEHIILVNMSPIQKELYNGFVEGLLGSVGHVNPIKGFHTCTKVSILVSLHVSGKLPTYPSPKQPFCPE